MSGTGVLSLRMTRYARFNRPEFPITSVCLGCQRRGRVLRFCDRTGHDDHPHRDSDAAARVGNARTRAAAPGAPCAEFFDRYFDEAGYLECVERWGGDDGPDDAIENVNDWPVLYALGGAEPILTRFKKAWEGHLRQYTKARTTEVPFRAMGCSTRNST